MKTSIWFFLLGLALYGKLNASHETPPIDVDANIAGFILEEKQIVVPGYPDAFNPSIIRWEDGRLLMSFRTRDPETKTANLVGFVFLNENYKAVGQATLLTINGDFPLKVSKAQGLKLFKTRNIYMIAYNNILNTPDLETRRMIVAHLNFNKGRFSIANPKYILSYEGDPWRWREKNWAPFDYKGNIHFSYTINPHKVFRLPRTSNDCITVANTDPEICWNWGEIRGGTPALRDGDQFLGFFHSWKDLRSVQSDNKKISHYFIGAYRFEASKFFPVTHISPEPIVGKTFYHAPDYPTWKPLKVIYPGGFILSEDYVWLIYGRQDHECWVAKIDKAALISSLVPL
jgi:hypothetical protein